MKTRQTNAPSTPRLLPAKRAAAALGIPYRSLLNVAHRGELPIVRFGTAVYFEATDIDRLVETRKATS